MVSHATRVDNGYVSYMGAYEWNGARVDAATKAAGRRGTRKGAEYLRSLAVPLAPIDLGPLRESATVRGVNAEPIALLIFDTPYAAVQHEREDYQHDDGQAKYVEQPMTEKQHEIVGIIAQEIRIGILNA